MTDNYIYILCLVAVLAVAMLLWALISRKKMREAKDALSETRTKLQLSEAALENARDNTAQQIAAKDEFIAQLKETHEKAIADLRAAHKETLKAQSDALKAELTAQTEQLLKQREEALATKAKETFETISGSLG